MRKMQAVIILSIIPQIVILFGLVVGGFLIIADPSSGVFSLGKGFFIIFVSLIAGIILNFNSSFLLIKSLFGQSAAHTRELRECIEVQFERLNYNLTSCIERLEKQTTRLFGVHTGELRECIKGLEKDLVILSDTIDKNSKTYIEELKFCSFYIANMLNTL